jgi:hypothetical protein
MSKIIDFFKNILKDRTELPIFQEPTRPFSGTFLLVWFYHHWQLVFIVFNFDKDQKLQEKIQTIKCYLNNVTWCNLWLIPALWTILALIIFYIFTNLGLTISTLFEYKIKPSILDWVGNKVQIVAKEDYSNLAKRIQTLETAKEEAEKKLLLIEQEQQVKDDKHKKELDSTTNDFLGILESVGPVRILSDINKISYVTRKNEYGLAKEEHVPDPDTNLHSSWINAQLKHTILNGARWITHKMYLSIEEEASGGSYEFVQLFTLPVDINKLAEATINLLVDDTCQITLNEQKLLNKKGDKVVLGYTELHTFNIMKELKMNNEIKFEITNNTSVYSRLEEFYKQGNRVGTANPYGFVFAIHLRYKF